MPPSSIRVTCPSHRMRLCFKRVNKLGIPALFHLVLPYDSQDTSEAVHVKHIQLFLLVCTHCLTFTSIKQSADYTGFIYIDFGVICQPVVGPCTFVSLESVMAAYPIRLLSSLSMEMLSVMADPRYINS